MQKVTVDAIEETVVKLSEHIQNVLKGPAADIPDLPNLVSATAQLASVIVAYDYDRLAKSSGRSGQR
jgi:hypothetical protein